MEPHLWAIAADLAGARDLSTLAAVLARAARQVAGADGAALVVREAELCRIIDAESDRRVPKTVSLCAWSLDRRESAAIEDIDTDPRVPAALHRHAFVKSAAIVPIRPDDPIGAVEVYWSQRHRASPQELEFLEALARAASHTIETVRLIDELTRARRFAEERSAELQGEVKQRGIVDEQTRQSQKMEAIGRLAGGVAHDFNNLLMVINGYGDRLSSALPAGSEPRSDVEEIRKAGARAATLVQQLLAFARQQVVAPSNVDLNGVIRDTIGLVRRLIPEHIDIVTRLDPKIGAVRADVSQLTQVLMNLAANARDAMPARGTLSLRTRAVELSAEEARSRTDLQPGPHVILEISDTGKGIDPTVLQHIFEPFFTTKGPQGTGLGLSTVYGIVKQCGGDVAVASEPGRGTTFTLYFPRAAGLATTTTRSATGGRMAGTETILVVEDEPAIRQLIETVLQSRGYRVLTATDPYQALELAEKHRGKLHLLLSDVVMPGLNGPEVARRVRAARPDIRILFMSGYAKQEIVGTLADIDAQLLAKPVGVDDLLRRVREVLDSVRG